MYLLRQLTKFGISPTIVKRFHRAVVENVLTFSITVWFGRTSYEEKAQLETLVRCASKIIGLTLPTIESVYHTRCVRKSKNIVPDATHPVNLPRNESISQGSGKYWEIPGNTGKYREIPRNRKPMGTQLWVANIMACSLNQS